VVDEVARIITSTLDIDEVYEKFAQEVKKLVDHDQMAINVIVPEAGAFVLKHLSGIARSQLSAGDMVPLAGTQTQHPANTGLTLLRSDVSKEHRFIGDQTFLQTGMRSTILVPLVPKGELLAP